MLVVGSPDVPAVAAALVSVAAAVRAPDPAINVSVVEQIPRHASTGKLRRFIALTD